MPKGRPHAQAVAVHTTAFISPEKESPMSPERSVKRKIDALIPSASANRCAFALRDTAWESQSSGPWISVRKLRSGSSRSV
jgi:hypothetical protein